MKRFLLAIDELSGARRVAEYLDPLVVALPGSKFHLLTLLVDCPYNDAELEARLEKSRQAPEVHGADDHLAQIEKVKLLHCEMIALLVAAGLDREQIFSEIHPLQNGTAEDILGCAERRACDTIIVARSDVAALRRLLAGSVSEDLIKQADKRAIWVVS